VEPIAVLHDLPTGRALTANARSDDVSVVDLAAERVIARLPVGCYPAGGGIGPARRTAFIGNTADGTVSLIDLDRLEVRATVTAKLAAGHDTVLLNETVGYAATVGVRGVPLNVLVDRAGTVRAVGVSTRAGRGAARFPRRHRATHRRGHRVNRAA
jgi:YVTN family beta-propeller protein